MVSGVEGTLPTNKAAPDNGWIANQFARLNFKTDGILERVKDALESRDDDRGPKDYAPSGDEVLTEFMRNMNRLMDRRPHMYNGDGPGGSEESLIKRWHLALAILGLMGLVIAGTWELSTQMDHDIGLVQSAQAAQATATQDIREHMRETDERITRIEQQLYTDRGSRLNGAP